MRMNDMNNSLTARDVAIHFDLRSVECLSQFLTAQANVALADVAVGYQNVAATSDTMGSHQPK